MFGILRRHLQLLKRMDATERWVDAAYRARDRDLAHSAQPVHTSSTDRVGKLADGGHCITYAYRYVDELMKYQVVDEQHTLKLLKLHLKLVGFALILKMALSVTWLLIGGADESLETAFLWSKYFISVTRASVQHFERRGRARAS